MNEPFIIESVQQLNSRSRNTRGEVCTVRFNPLEEIARPDLTMTTLITRLLDRVLAGRPPPLRVGLQLHPPAFHNPFTVPLRPPAQNNPAALAAAIERLNEMSQAGIDLLAGTTVTKVVAVWPLDAQLTDNPADHTGACNVDIEHNLTPKCRSIVQVINPTDRFCLARAVNIGLKRIGLMELNGPQQQQQQQFRSFCSQQDRHYEAAYELMQNAGLPLDLQQYSLDHVNAIQNFINQTAGNTRIVVFQKEQQYRIVFKGSVRAARFNICLLLQNNHYNYIGRPEQLFRAHRFCIDCERRVTRLYHWAGCSVVCRLCMRTGPDYPCQVIERIRCNDCGFVFPQRSCFNHHLTNHAPEEITGHQPRPFLSICQSRRICTVCGHIIFGQQQHNCIAPPQQQQQLQQQAVECNKCKGPHLPEQPCYIQPLPIDQNFDNNEELNQEVEIEEQQQQHPQQGRGIRRNKQKLRLCFFDAETSQEQTVQISSNNSGYKHIPLLIIAEVICEKCINAGIGINDIGERAAGCFCGKPSNSQWRKWCSPPFNNATGDNTPVPSTLFYNPRRMYFHSFDNEEENPVDQFLDYLLNHGSRDILTICIAHNGGKYDFHLVLEALHRRSLPPNFLCTTGLKIYSMGLSGNHQRKLLFKDSLNYFICELDALPKIFSLPEEVATVKPFFPYLYIKRQHLHRRIQGLPALHYYQPDFKKFEKRAKLIEWHQQQINSGVNFQLREQLILYCANDVAILRESVLRYRRLIGEHTRGLDPFQAASTAAGLALTTMRRCFLPKNWLVHSPEGGYLRGRRASAESQRYIRLFELENEEARGKVQCAQWAVGEAHVEDCGYRLDGLWFRSPPLRPLAIEYMGCYYHGCPRCFPIRNQRLAAGRTAEELYERTQNRLCELEQQHGYSLHVVWGHEMKDRLRNNPQLRRKWDEIDCVKPMDPRNDCLRGGRTEPFKLHHECAPDEEILYIDIVSLYPYVMKARSFPIGHPSVLTREVLLSSTSLPWTSTEQNIYQGLLLVRVLPPTTLNGLPPLLAYRTYDGRLTFPFCSTCANNKQQRHCRHGDRQRSWVSGYTHVELNRAIELGYKVIDIHEVWQYDRWDQELFRPYVNTFICLKQQASGWPQGCDTQEERENYIAEFERVEGIKMDPQKIEVNPGLRLIAKILANSLWGKLAQRVGGTDVKYARTPAEFHQLLEDPTIETLDFDHVSEYMDRCVVRKKEEFAKPPDTNCLQVASFVTSYARLHLYQYMEEVHRVGGRLLYCDTDSIIYVAKLGGERVDEGEALGQMKREHPERRIIEFLAGGPKNYGYRHVDALTGNDERAELKIRSFPLSYATHQMLNFKSMKELVLGQYNIDGEMDEMLSENLLFNNSDRTNFIRVEFPQIGRTRRSLLYTNLARKEYRPCYEKGRIRPNMETLPFGYRNETMAQQQQQQYVPTPSNGRRKRPSNTTQQMGARQLDLQDLPGSSEWTETDYLRRYPQSF
uniref:DNA-directed DNA polymerase n=3 Tax=Meloidogyne TaxID=189290 RepID=A0A6V7W9H6_MELEN|nr:unnamed protein product [Meloidogyne enterolobii]